jgi:hypothetical protein
MYSWLGITVSGLGFDFSIAATALSARSLIPSFGSSSDGMLNVGVIFFGNSKDLPPSATLNRL